MGVKINIRRDGSAVISDTIVVSDEEYTSFWKERVRNAYAETVDSRRKGAAAPPKARKTS